MGGVLVHAPHLLLFALFPCFLTNIVKNILNCFPQITEEKRKDLEKRLLAAT
jgi:hypothetical protein